jgi:hypothetical protein
MAKIHTCDCCGRKLGEIACSNKYGGNYCSVICADTAEATGGLNVSKKIRIKSALADDWYLTKIGAIYTVQGEHEDGYYVNEFGTPKVIHKADCEIVSEESAEFDVVQKPAHYNSGKYEVIDVIEDSLRDIPNGFEAYCIGNVQKYIARYRHKNGVEDLRKAAWYINRATESKGDTSAN